MAEEINSTEDREYDPAVEPESSRAWLNLLEDAEKKFRDYQDTADRIDRLYASLQRQRDRGRDREFALFWANIEVLKPSIYARPPLPVVVPKFKDRRPLFRVASELLERATHTAFDLADINSIMLLLRDDLAIVGRGVPWVRYETKAESGAPTERVCIDFLDRRDFLHEPARYWCEVGWVARRAWLTKDQMRERFRETSGDAYERAAYEVRKKDQPAASVDPRATCGVWEIWSKTEDKVVWVTEGVDVLLDEGEPHLKLEGFFPCPRPAYATLERRSLVPVPDVLYYEDQLIEIDKLTNRIHALADAIQVKGFYPAGGDIGDAVESALKQMDDRALMVPVSNFAAFGQAGDAIVWLPIDMIAQTVAGLIEMRRQIIDDVYQIMGLSDIMRGSTQADETATAQQIKAQYGSVRIRDKQAELVRVARDLVRICAEIMAENFDQETLLDMSQMEIPTDAEIAEQRKALEKRAKEIAAKAKETQAALRQPAPPEAQQQAQVQDQQAQQALQAAQAEIEKIGQQIAKLDETPTVEKVMALLRDQKIRPFALDIETDSTIQPDEDAEKQRRTEFMQAFMGAAQSLGQLVAMEPASAPLAGEMLRFVLAPFRAGRQMEGAVDDFVDQVVQRAQQPRPNPEAERAQAEMAMEQKRMAFEQKKVEAEMQARREEQQFKAQIEAARTDADIQLKTMDAQMRREEAAAKLRQIEAQMARDEMKGQLETRKLQLEIERLQLDGAVKIQDAQIRAESAEREMAQKAAMNAQQQRPAS
ncbi:MAG TPA: hypothetical protein VIK75_10335 [Calditerricola sp.]